MYSVSVSPTMTILSASISPEAFSRLEDGADNHCDHALVLQGIVCHQARSRVTFLSTFFLDENPSLRRLLSDRNSIVVRKLAFSQDNDASWRICERGSNNDELA